MPIAWSPATPVPRMSTLAGRAVPAAVVSMGKKRPNAAAPTRAALYPATLACELSASMPCARDSVLGSPSRLIAVIPRDARVAASPGSASGLSMPMIAWPDRSPPRICSSGLPTVRTRSAPASSSSRLTMVAPASA